ncbi:peptidase C15 pyroglutamyl peptidase I-like protein [Pleurotus eryngii]|uniref:Peptidase C15 pyroglutamyl peptidase I-like protein n=1 Tax=Pleurotus eryngii TaxID=5323 RepID=A0A9P6A9D4_PLEER|nr:peptidase C15 pyroglutamyl peptidase I-like protein [Pleurotus eryngii]
MPAVPTHSPTEGPNEFRVLVTGFGPFAHFDENPSWLAVKPLHKTTLATDPTSNPIIVNQQVAVSGSAPRMPRPIHISALQIPVTYEAVLNTVPGLHSRPPILPEGVDPDFPAPPEEGYDLMFHIGVAGRGPLRMERIGHKLGYQMKDVSGKLASVIISSGENIARQTRGFGAAYETFPDEITTEVDVTRLVQDLKRSGIEQIYTSMDAGHYLCDFIYYCSLAEAKRTAKPYEKRRNTQVLFLHCPPVNQPLTTEEVTEAITRIIVWICQEIEAIDATENPLQVGASATTA